MFRRNTLTRRSKGHELNSVFGKDKIEKPLQGNVKSFLPSWEIGQIHASPKEPGSKTEKLVSIDLRYSAASTNRSMLADCIENEFLCRFAAQAAARFSARTFACRKACWAVGG